MFQVVSVAGDKYRLPLFCTFQTLLLSKSHQIIHNYLHNTASSPITPLFYRSVLINLFSRCDQNLISNSKIKFVYCMLLRFSHVRAARFHLVFHCLLLHILPLFRIFESSLLPLFSFLRFNLFCDSFNNLYDYLSLLLLLRALFVPCIYLSLSAPGDSPLADKCAKICSGQTDLSPSRFVHFCQKLITTWRESVTLRYNFWNLLNVFLVIVN